MKSKQQIEAEIDRTLQQFEPSEKLPENPWFATRLQQRIETEPNERITFAAVLKPAILVLLLAVNIISAAVYLRADTKQPAQDQHAAVVQILAADLNVAGDGETSNIRE
jgi:hypothetical protein